ncbi:hypothetical protein [Janthinobacterium sp.]|uniref:hypothetical protein n=1 Tax=Janthinobacterium sp. TaxID=1871054 RepID=UPI00293D4A05|nr:hypothetical protein [Janthinobacterium sp.]
MTPIAHFQSVWERCEQIAGIHTYLSGRLTVALSPDELLRAEWVARVSALDLYVHELVAQQMLEIFEGRRTPSSGFQRFTIPNDVLMRIRAAESKADESSAFDLEVRSRLGFATYQDPDKIADGVRQFSDVELWNEIAIKQGATNATKVSVAKALKRGLSLIVERRNKIAHEGDLQPGAPRVPWPINRADLQEVARMVLLIVMALEQIA